MAATSRYILVLTVLSTMAKGKECFEEELASVKAVSCERPNSTASWNSTAECIVCVCVCVCVCQRYIEAA